MSVIIFSFNDDTLYNVFKKKTNSNVRRKKYLTGSAFY